ncbi:hypothetical protein N2605_27055 [Bradyrhizobium yuanmingense]|uniref:hypothetical protein n=1 Tax=Bradyrhizobium yuanmingense TaxID=108015 RepID=UPI0021A830DA|nr:hypothetical protein N2605_27055 [Bradyrhizobium sp. CB1024]
MQAALGRRIFDAGQEPETVDYSHRTMAEYLAAEFLAARVRDGLPFGRVVALLGVDGHPAAELRGLHAWLAVHLPERADELIEAAPYGVLTYGDAASLTPSSCASLVRALDRLSKENRWFRSGNWESRSIGGLARPDMVGEFRAILNHPDSGFGVRSVVVDGLALGTPIPAMLPDLAAVLARQASPFAERARALAALLRYGSNGETAIKQVFDSALGKTANDLRLRTEIIRALYGGHFGAAEVVALLNDARRVKKPPAPPCSGSLPTILRSPISRLCSMALWLRMMTANVSTGGAGKSGRCTRVYLSAPGARRVHSTRSKPSLGSASASLSRAATPKAARATCAPPCARRPSGSRNWRTTSFGWCRWMRTNGSPGIVFVKRFCSS